MHSLRDEIKKRLALKGMSVNALEKAACLKPGAVQNIMQGKSKHPRADILVAIAGRLDCTVDELMGHVTSIADDEAPSPASGWDTKLYMDVMKFVQTACERHGSVPEKEHFMRLVEDIYQYSVGSEAKALDTRFADWVVERYFVRG